MSYEVGGIGRLRRFGHREEDRRGADTDSVAWPGALTQLGPDPRSVVVNGVLAADVGILRVAGAPADQEGPQVSPALRCPLRSPAHCHPWQQIGAL